MKAARSTSSTDRYPVSEGAVGRWGKSPFATGFPRNGVALLGRNSCIQRQPLLIRSGEDMNHSGSSTTGRAQRESEAMSLVATGAVRALPVDPDEQTVVEPPSARVSQTIPGWSPSKMSTLPKAELPLASKLAHGASWKAKSGYPLSASSGDDPRTVNPAATSRGIARKCRGGRSATDFPHGRCCRHPYRTRGDWVAGPGTAGTGCPLSRDHRSPRSAECSRSGS